MIRLNITIHRSNYNSKLYYAQIDNLKIYFNSVSNIGTELQFNNDDKLSGSVMLTGKSFKNISEDLKEKGLM
jgi:hypothetical protein